MHRRDFLARLGAAATVAAGAPLLLGAAAAISSKNASFNPREFGALGDGVNLDTKPVQAAIDACAQAGGGTVLLAAGRYLCGTLFLRSKVHLHLEAGAVLLGSRSLTDYPPTLSKLRSYTDNYTERSLIYGEDLEEVSITGQGQIDGQGAAFKGPYKVRPYLIRFVACRDVAVCDVTLRDSAMWVQHYLACEGVLIEGITVRSKVNANNDGLDIDGCQQVRIANCDISSGDDAIALKSTLERPCRNVVVSNCILSSDCNAFKLGTESNGGFENVVLSNCVIYDTHLAGLAVELVDGGLLERVSLSHVVMQRVNCPVFIRLGHRGRPFRTGQEKAGVGRLRNVTVTHLRAEGANRVGCSITGLPEHPAEGITLEDVQVGFSGGGSETDAQRQVPEQADHYPEYEMFGTLPAYGFYGRHLKDLRLSRVRVACAAADARPALVCDDVEGLEVFDWQAGTVSKPHPEIALRNVRRAFLHGCRQSQEGVAFLRVEGRQSAGIKLLDNDLAAARKAVELGKDVAKGVVSQR